MNKILAVTAHSTDDPTLCTGAFVTALGALEAGLEASVVLIAEGAYLTNPEVVNHIHGVGFPPLPEVIEKVVAGKIPVYV
jgi:predicted peroxiredoxin